MAKDNQSSIFHRSEPFHFAAVASVNAGSINPGSEGVLLLTWLVRMNIHGGRPESTERNGSLVNNKDWNVISWNIQRKEGRTATTLKLPGWQGIKIKGSSWSAPSYSHIENHITRSSRGKSYLTCGDRENLRGSEYLLLIEKILNGLFANGLIRRYSLRIYKKVVSWRMNFDGMKKILLFSDRTIKILTSWMECRFSMELEKTDQRLGLGWGRMQSWHLFVASNRHSVAFQSLARWPWGCWPNHEPRIDPTA